MGRERLWDQGSLCPRAWGPRRAGSGSAAHSQGYQQQAQFSFPHFLVYRSNLSLLQSLKALCPSHRGGDGHTMGHQEILGYEHLDTSGFHPPTPATGTWHILGTELMYRHKHCPTAPEMPNKGSWQDL